MTVRLFRLGARYRGILKMIVMSGVLGVSTIVTDSGGTLVGGLEMGCSGGF